MKLLVLGWEETRSLFSMKECIDVIETAFVSLAKGEVVLPLRTVMRQSDNKGLLASIPGFLGEPRSLGIKDCIRLLWKQRYEVPFSPRSRDYLRYQQWPATCGY